MEMILMGAMTFLFADEDGPGCRRAWVQRATPSIGRSCGRILHEPSGQAEGGRRRKVLLAGRRLCAVDIIGGLIGWMDLYDG